MPRLVLTLTALLMIATSVRAEGDLPLWLLQTKLSGDFRYRHEGIDKTLTAAQYRNRIRYRLALDTQINDKVKLGARFASQGDWRSTNQDLKGEFSPKGVVLDRAYIEVSPCELRKFQFGKFGNPFWTTDLLWDHDINFEGGALSGKFAENFPLKFGVGGFWLEPYKSGHATGLLCGQLSLKGKTEDIEWGGAIGTHGYSNIDGLNAVGFGSYGNTVDSTGNYVAEFSVVDVMGQVTVPMGASKVEFTVNPVMNMATDEENIGWLAMLKWKGKLADRAASLSYDYRVLEADAIVGAFTDSDAAGGRTDQRGHRVMADFEAMENFSLGGSAYFNTLASSGDGDWYQRWMLDMMVKFCPPS
jgi:hypothetical protein